MVAEDKMLKKVFKFIKALLVCSVWSIIYLYIANTLMIYIWNFDLLNYHHWEVINTFWEKGGKIKTGKDYLFVTMLLAIIPVWLVGCRFFYKVNYLNILLFPITYYNNRMIKKYGENTPRIVLKNMGATREKPKLEDLIESRLKESSPKTEKESSKIRQNIQNKISSANKP